MDAKKHEWKTARNITRFSHLMSLQGELAMTVGFSAFPLDDRALSFTLDSQLHLFG